MIKIEILDDDVVTRNFDKDGKSFSFREQEAFLHFPGEKYPSRFKISLGSDAAYRPGFYVLSSESFTVDRYGSLALRRSLKLLPED